MFKSFLVLFLGLFLFCGVSHAQFGNIIDAPQHAFVVGAGVGPTSHDFSVLAGFGDKLPSTTATYSYSGVSIIPSLVKQLNGSTSVAVVPVAHTGVKQILYQANRFSFGVDGGGGVSLPSTQSSTWDFAMVGGIDFLWRLNKVLDATPGGTNNYIAFEPQFTQLTGTTGGTVVSLAVAWVHGVNGNSTGVHRK